MQTRHTKFCNKCGSELLLVNKRESNGYNTQTGKRGSVEKYQCPNYSVLNYFNPHTKTTVYYSTSKKNKILFEDDNLGLMG